MKIGPNEICGTIISVPGLLYSNFINKNIGERGAEGENIFLHILKNLNPS